MYTGFLLVEWNDVRLYSSGKEGSLIGWAKHFRGDAKFTPQVGQVKVQSVSLVWKIQPVTCMCQENKTCQGRGWEEMEEKPNPDFINVASKTASQKFHLEKKKIPRSPSRPP